MKKLTTLFIICILSLGIQAQVHLVPAPQKLTLGDGQYGLPQQTTIAYATAELKPAAEYLQTCLKRYTSTNADVVAGKQGTIRLAIKKGIAKDCYQLNIADRGINIIAANYGSAISAIATLNQLLLQNNNKTSVPYVSITDAPRFEWRGFHLDVSRHFFTVDEVKEFIDLMSLYKLNRFHWHLTDDQGWRIEIKKYPLLTEKGAWRIYNNQDTTCWQLAARDDNPDLLVPRKNTRVVNGDTLYGGFYKQEEIRDVEHRVNEMIRQCLPLEEHRAMPIAEAQKLGAMALFGEKYGDRVRVVKYGPSIEFCGGTHVQNTGMIGSFRIVSEGAIAAGMRRIEAVTAQGATDYADRQQEQLAALADLFKGTKDLASSIAKLQDDNAALKATVEQMQKEKAAGVARSIAARLASSPSLVERMDSDVNTLKDAVMALRNEHPDMAVVLGSVNGGKPALLIVLGQARVDAGLNAGLMVRTLGKEIQGGGGGQPHFATAGGKNPDGLDKALALARDLINQPQV